MTWLHILNSNEKLNCELKNTKGKLTLHLPEALSLKLQAYLKTSL